MAGVRTVLGMLGALMLLAGGIWILQGLNVPGVLQSFMTSDITWTYRGVGFAAAGLIMLVWALRAPGAWRDVIGGLGALLAVLALIWILRDVGVLPGPNGRMETPVRGIVVFVIGAVLIFIGARGAKASV